MTRKITLAVLPVFWLLGVANLFHPLAAGRYLGDVGDTRYNLYILEHEYKLVTDRAYPGTYSSAPMWIPDASENSMGRSDMLTGAQPFYFLPRLFLSRDHAYQAFFLIVATLNFLAFFWLCRSVGVDSPLVAALAAWVFAFGMYKVQHTVHTQFYLQFWGVAFIGFLIRFLRAPGRMTLFRTALFLGVLASPYTGVFYSLAAVLFVAICWALAGRAAVTLVWDAFRRDFFGLSGAAAVALGPVLALMLPYLRQGSHLSRSWTEVFQGIPAPRFWFLPFQGSLWWFAAHLAGTPHETSSSLRRTGPHRPTVRTTRAILRPSRFC